MHERWWKSSVQKSNVIWYLIVCFALHHFSSFFWKLCGQINTRQTNYGCELSECIPFCRRTHTHTHAFVPSKNSWIHGQKLAHAPARSLSLAITIYFVYWIATKLLNRFIYFHMYPTCSHISHSIWRNINNTKAWAQAKCSNLTEIFALLLRILVPFYARSLSLSLFVLFFLFHFSFRTLCPYFIACRMPSKCKTTYESNTPADCIFFLFETMKLVKCCFAFTCSVGLVRLRLFFYIPQYKSVSSSFCLFARVVRLFINEIQYYELWALCITLLHWPLCCWPFIILFIPNVMFWF